MIIQDQERSLISINFALSISKAGYKTGAFAAHLQPSDKVMDKKGLVLTIKYHEQCALAHFELRPNHQHEFVYSQQTMINPLLENR